MLSFLLLTYLLSCLGVGLFLLVKNRLDFGNQKFSLLCIVFLSISIPIYFIGDNDAAEEVRASNHYHFSEQTFNDFCPKEEVLDACYMLATNETEFCKCETIEKENLLVYRSDFWYNLFLFQEKAFSKLLIVGALGIFFLFLARLLYLYNLIRGSEKEVIQLNGESFTILKSPKPLGVGAFQLINKYIIWQDEMSSLPKEDLESILWHEISHIRQRDTWLKIAINFLQIIWVFNPAFYFIKSELNALSEYIADQYAILKTKCSAKEYALLLLRMTERRTPVMVSAFRKGELKDRIERILDGPKMQSIAFRVPLTLVMTVCFALLTYKSLPVIDTQVNKLKVYETMSVKQSQTGQSVFCKECIIQECLEE